MSSSSGARPPRLLLAAIGNGVDGYYQVRWEGEALEWRFRDERERVVPDARAWRMFWRAVEQNKVWEWRDRYERHSVEEGTYWILELVHEGAQLSSSGANAYPPGPRGSGERTREFERFCAAVSRLAGGRRFG